MKCYAFLVLKNRFARTG